MNKKIFTAAASVTAAIAAVGLITAGTAHATTPLGPSTNSCVGKGGSAALPVAVANGVFIKDPGALASTSVLIRSIGTGSLNGDSAGQLKPMDGIFVPTNGIGIGTLSGTYLRAGGEACTVNGTFMLT